MAWTDGCAGAVRKGAWGAAANGLPRMLLSLKSACRLKEAGAGAVKGAVSNGDWGESRAGRVHWCAGAETLTGLPVRLRASCGVDRPVWIDGSPATAQHQRQHKAGSWILQGRLHARTAAVDKLLTLKN